MNFCFFSVVGGRDFFFSLMLFNGVGTRVVTVISCVWNLVTDEGTGRGNSAYVMHVAFLKITDLSSAAKWGYLQWKIKQRRSKKTGRRFLRAELCARLFRVRCWRLVSRLYSYPDTCSWIAAICFDSWAIHFSFSICIFLVL